MRTHYRVGDLYVLLATYNTASITWESWRIISMSQCLLRSDHGIVTWGIYEDDVQWPVSSPASKEES